MMVTLKFLSYSKHLIYLSVDDNLSFLIQIMIFLLLVILDDFLFFLHTFIIREGSGWFFLI